ncbi:MAG TPA: hypothetical protein GX731_00340 [Clostridiales bacterium]|nr:hypothetical protein [Clostridiales bacterium]
MWTHYLPALIMLIAGAITSIIDIINKVELVTSLKRLLVVLIVFYILGLITRAVVEKTLEERKKTEEEVFEETESDESNNPD